MNLHGLSPSLVLVCLWSLLNKVNGQGSCGATLSVSSGQSGEFHYPPNYPAPYPENTVCRWALNTRAGFTIQVQFNDQFGIQGRDFLAVVDGSHLGRLPSACDLPGYFNLGNQGEDFILIRGDRSEFLTFTSKSNAILAVFCSQNQRGSTIPRIGFRAMYFAIPKFPVIVFPPAPTPVTRPPITAAPPTLPPFFPPTLPPIIPQPITPPFFFTTPSITTTTTTTTTTTRPTTASPIFSNDVPCGSPIFPPIAGRIIGGNPAVFGSWPYIVAVIDSRYNGVLVDQSWVITAAHCVVDKPSQHLMLRVGATDFNASATDPRRGVDRTAAFTIIHPGFDGNTFINDIALIRLSNPVQFNQFIRPICLPTGPSQVGVVCAIAGFGLTTPLRKKRQLGVGGNVVASGSSTLMETDVPIVQRDLCQSFFSAAFPGLITVTNSHVCAGSVYPVARDSCNGDSGGPMICRKNGRYELVGVTSFGVGCGRNDVFGVYTNVWEQLAWINSIRGEATGFG